MKIKINEKQILPLHEAYQNSFSFETLSSIGGSGNIEEDNRLRYEYCVKHLGEPVGEGSSRVVFTLTDNHILKLALNSKYALSLSPGAGEEQNKREFELYKKIESDLIAKILYCDKNYYYIICENVIPAEETDFEKYLNIPFSNVWRQTTVKTSAEDEFGGDEVIGYNDYFDGTKKKYEPYEGKCVYDILCYIESNYVLEDYWYDDEIEDIIKNSKWFTELVDFVEYTQTSDFTHVENYGIVNRGGKPMIVLLDYGLDLDVWEEYYS